MGGETSPKDILQAVIMAAEAFSQLQFSLFASQEVISQIDLSTYSLEQRCKFVLCEETIGMDDEPLSAIRRKKKSSLVLGVEELRQGKCDGFISNGNTGALVAASALWLPRFPSITRPALMATVPVKGGTTAVIDVGGNVHCTVNQLEQFALLGAAYQKVQMKEDQKIRIGLLNIGAESKKGTSLLRAAFQKLNDRFQDSKEIEFIGNIEGRELFQGCVDVLVSDGFSGNILLKTAEGISSYLFFAIREALAKEYSEAHKALADIEKLFHPSEYSGALIAGIDALVIKCHGNASAKTFFNAIADGVRFMEENLLGKVKAALLY
jgi:glycerol-3-phosphate acyltransferase PlsX